MSEGRAAMPGVRKRASMTTPVPTFAHAAPRPDRLRRAALLAGIAVLAAAAVYGVLWLHGRRAEAPGASVSMDAGVDAAFGRASLPHSPVTRRSGPRAAARASSTWAASEPPASSGPAAPASASPWFAPAARPSAPALSRPWRGHAAKARPPRPAMACHIMPDAPPRLRRLCDLFLTTGIVERFATTLDCGEVFATYAVDVRKPNRWTLRAIYTSDSVLLCARPVPEVYRHTDGSISWQTPTPVRLSPCSLQDYAGASDWTRSIVSELRATAVN